MMVSSVISPNFPGDEEEYILLILAMGDRRYHVAQEEPIPQLPEFWKMRVRANDHFYGPWVTLIRTIHETSYTLNAQ